MNIGFQDAESKLISSLRDLWMSTKVMQLQKVHGCISIAKTLQPLFNTWHRRGHKRCEKRNSKKHVRDNYSKTTSFSSTWQWMYKTHQTNEKGYVLRWIRDCTTKHVSWGLSEFMLFCGQCVAARILSRTTYVVGDTPTTPSSLILNDLAYHWMVMMVLQEISWQNRSTIHLTHV